MGVGEGLLAPAARWDFSSEDSFVDEFDNHMLLQHNASRLAVIAVANGRSTGTGMGAPQRLGGQLQRR